MSVTFRIILIIASIITFLYMLKKIRQSKLQIDHALFWVIFSVMLVVMGVFPQIAIGLSNMLELQSPANLVFLFIIFILLVRMFQMTLEISKLEDKLGSMIRHEAIREYEEDKEKE